MACEKNWIQKQAQLELADILAKFGNGKAYTSHESKVVNRIINCRTANLGGHKEFCDHCNAEHILYNSCCDRHCPKCQSLARLKWVAARIDELLPVQYFHVVFTMDSNLYGIFLRNKKVCYSLLFKASSDTLKEVAETKLKAEIGFTGMLHTWTQQQGYHPHVHYVVAGGGLSFDHEKWISSKQDYFLPVRILSKVFRGKLLSLLEANFEKLENVGTKEEFKTQLRRATKHDWVVYAKKPFAGPKQVIEYLGNYTHRIAISNSRLRRIDGEDVVFTYKDRKDGGKTKELQIKGTEFVKRFLNHIVPRKFNRIRHYGFLGRRGKKKLLPLCKKLLKVNVETKSNETEWQELLKIHMGVDPTKCRVCKIGNMVKTEVIKPLLKLLKPLSKIKDTS